jgi:hypothetical protein
MCVPSKSLVFHTTTRLPSCALFLQVIASLKGLPTVLQLQRAAGMTSLSKPAFVAACNLISKQALSDAAFKAAFKGQEMAKFRSQKSVADALAPRSGKEAKKETKETKSEAFGSGFSPPAAQQTMSKASPAAAPTGPAAVLNCEIAQQMRERLVKDFTVALDDIQPVGNAGDSFVVRNFLSKLKQPVDQPLLEKEFKFLDPKHGPQNRARQKLPRMKACVIKERQDDGLRLPYYGHYVGARALHYHASRSLSESPIVSTLFGVVDGIVGRPHNHVIATKYRDENDNIAWHSDKYHDLVAGSFITSLSFGATRDLSFSLDGGKSVAFALPLAAGDLFVMGPKTNAMYAHSVLPSAEAIEERMSLIFRSVETHKDKYEKPTKDNYPSAAAAGAGSAADQDTDSEDEEGDVPMDKGNGSGSSEKGKKKMDEGEDEDDAEVDSGSGGKEEKKSVVFASPPRRISERVPVSKAVYTDSSSQKNPPSRSKKRKAPEKAAASAASEKKAAASSAEATLTQQQVLEALKKRIRMALGDKDFAKLRTVKSIAAGPIDELPFGDAPFVVVDMPLDVEGQQPPTAAQILGDLQFEKQRDSPQVGKQQHFVGTKFKSTDVDLEDEEVAKARLLQPVGGDADKLLERKDGLHLPFLTPQNYGKRVHDLLLPIGLAVEGALGFSSRRLEQPTFKIPRLLEVEMEECATNSAGDGTRVDRFELFPRGALGFTEDHDELGHARALHYMLRCAPGALLWFGFFIRDVLKAFGGAKMVTDEIREQVFENADPVALLKLLLKKKVPVWMAEHLPGQVVISSPANGSTHAVLGASGLGMAWNDRITLDGLRSVAEVWPWRMKLTSISNNGLYTQAAVPWLLLEKAAMKAGVETLGRSAALDYEELLKADVEQHAVHGVQERKLSDPPTGCSTHLPHVAHNLDLYHVEGTCLSCWVERFPPPGYPKPMPKDGDGDGEDDVQEPPKKKRKTAHQPAEEAVVP